MARSLYHGGRKMKKPLVIRLLMIFAVVSWCDAALAASANSAASGAAAGVDSHSIEANSATTRDWPTYGLDYSETRFSRLTQINANTVKDLGLVWSYDLQSSRGVESTPLVVDGVMYVTAPWSVVHAIDAITGRHLWTFDPKVPRTGGWRACCDVVNRGVALYRGKVYVGTLDGRLVAINAADGKQVWERDDVADHSFNYSITGAPRVYNGQVIIGVAGGEYGVRGYVTAYDAETGKRNWRWFTVPGDPSKPFENDAMKKAAKTWDPSAKYWQSGGGGTTWNAMAFDPALNLIYIGTDNGSPWSAHKRSPRGGDNLYTCSIVALNATTGGYVWHYQNTPADDWDFSAVQDIILANLMIDGKIRKVVMQAPKNGFYFVIDRTTGQFISAKNFVDVNWASGYDANGRPIELTGARAIDKPYEFIGAGPYGAHNWQSMSWNPTLGLAYIPAQSVPVTMNEDKNWTGHDSRPLGEPMSNIGWNLAKVINPVTPKSLPYGQLIAWDPVQQKKVWSVQYVAPWNGGTLATAGNLVFQGTADGRFIAYSATTGNKLWETPTGTGVIAAPMSYEIGGKQYVSIAVGWGGTDGQIQRSTDRNTPGAVYTFALGGHAKLPTFVAYPMGDLVAGVKYDPADIPAGRDLYVSNCLFCHGVPGVHKGGSIRNLGYAPAGLIEDLQTIVFKGPLMELGMPDFTGRLTADDVDKIKAFIQGTADSIRPQVQQSLGAKVK